MKRFFRRALMFVRGPYFLPGIIVTYGQSETTVNSVTFRDGTWRYRLCGYPLVSFNDEDITRMRDKYVSKQLPRRTK